MKKAVIFLFIANCFFGHAQAVKEIPIESDALFAKCKSAVSDYMHNTIDKKTFGKYFEFQRDYSYAIVSHNLKVFDGRQPTKGEILGYVVSFQIKPEYTFNSYRGSIGFRLFVNTAMKVWFDNGWNSGSNLSFENNIAPRLNLQPEDRSLQFIQSMKQYIVALDNGKLLNEKQILAAADAHEPGMKWRKPIISRDSFPPYTAYWEVTQDNCQQCKVLQIKIDDAIIIKTSEVTFVGL